MVKNNFPVSLEGRNFNQLPVRCQGAPGKNFSLLAKLKLMLRTCNFYYFFSCDHILKIPKPKINVHAIYTT